MSLYVHREVIDTRLKHRTNFIAETLCSVVVF